MSSRGMLRNSIRGFTLVELLVVVAIMAVMAVVAAPFVAQVIAKQQVKSATYDLVNALQDARNNAILYRRSIDVRASYPGTSSNIWNGLTGTLNTTNVTTADQAKILNTSFYTLKTGSALNNTTATDNLVTQFATFNSSVIANANIATVRFNPDATVQVATATAPTVFTQLTATQTFTITSKKTIDLGYTVSISVFGFIKAAKNYTGGGS